MSVLLANLMARAPTAEDFYAIAELVAACDIAEHGIADGSTGDLAARWQNYSFQMESDAWVIVNSRRQSAGFAGFACVLHRDHEEFYAFICVHPLYRKRGIGTLLLRIAEQRARELMRQTSHGVRVSLRGVVSASNSQGRSLYEREGYLAVREFWRVALDLLESDDADRNHAEKFAIDVDVEDGRLVGAAPLFDREGVYSIRHFVTYEKELRPAIAGYGCPDDYTEMLVGA